jgi:hypothetical protein
MFYFVLENCKKKVEKSWKKNWKNIEKILKKVLMLKKCWKIVISYHETLKKTEYQDKKGHKKLE